MANCLTVEPKFIVSTDKVGNFLTFSTDINEEGNVAKKLLLNEHSIFLGETVLRLRTGNLSYLELNTVSLSEIQRFLQREREYIPRREKSRAACTLTVMKEEREIGIGREELVDRKR